MTFWIIAALVTAASILLIILPVFSARNRSANNLDYDREIYKARISEIESELKLGTIDQQRYEYAIAEEGRRFLAHASGQEETSGFSSDSSKKLAFVTAMFMLIAIPLVAIFGYLQLGAPERPDLPLEVRLKADPSTQSVEILLQRAELQLIKNPDDGRGWRVIAPVYMRLGRYDDAIKAYRNAIRVLGVSSELQTALAEAITVGASGIVSEEAKSLFSQALEKNPEDYKAMFFLAIALNQEGNHENAVTAWGDLIRKSPPNAPWLRVARQQLQLAQSSAGVDVPGNPTKQDVEDAKELSAEDRAEFINSMVENLAESLAENPNNKPGWQRIIRSYIVLGRKDDALAAITTAMETFKDDAAFVAELERSRQALTK